MRALRFVGILALLVLSALAPLGPLAGPSTADAATLNVCPSGCTYTQITDAINAASNGDTITIAASQYGGDFTISKSVKLVGTAGIGPAATYINGSLTIAGGQTVTIENVVIRAYTKRGNGGAILNQGTLTLTNTAVDYGVADYGGGIYNDNGTLTVNSGTFMGNHGGWGGGIYNRFGTVTVNNSTFIGNVANSSGGCIFNEGSLALNNSTFTQNSARYGGCIMNNGSLTVTNSTISGNSAGMEGGGIYGAGTLANTILAGNSAPVNSDCTGTLTSGAGGHNLLSTPCLNIATSDANGNQVGVDPKLGALGSTAYGAPPATMPLLTDSPANGAGDAATCESMVGPNGVLDTDQRGSARNSASRGACDIGAYDTGVNPSGNLSPTVDAGGGYASEGESASLSGWAEDPDNTILTYQWSYTAGSNVDAPASCSFSDATSIQTMMTCTDDGTYTATLTVSDGVNPPVSDAATVTVYNVVPSATFNAPAGATEGDTFEISLTNPTDPSPVDVAAGFSYSFDCGDGNGFSFLESSPSAICTAGNAGTQTVKAKIADKDTGTGDAREYSANVTITPANQAPVADAGTDQTVDVGATVTLDGSSSSDPDGGTLGYSWELVSHTGPSVSLSSSTAVSPTFVTTGGGSYTFTLTVSDGQGGVTSDDVVITVNNPTPTTTAISPQSAQAGGQDFTLTVEGTNYVPESVVQWNGQDLTTTFVSASTLTAQVPAGLTANAGTADITVSNPAPGGGVSNAQPLFVTQSGTSISASDTEGSTNGTAMVSVGVTGPNTGITAVGTGTGSLTIAQYTSNPVGTAPLNAVNAYFDVYVPSDSAFTSVTVVDCDLAGGSEVSYWDGSQWVVVDPQSYDAATGCTTLTLSVDSVPSISQLSGTSFGISAVAPTVAAGDDVSGNEGAAISLNGSATDPDSATLSYEWSYSAVDDVDPGASCSFGDAASAQTTITCTDDGSYSVELTVSDGVTPSVSATAAVTVNNVAPSVDSITAPADPVAMNTSVSTSATFTDPGTSDTHTATWDWGDGTSSAGIVNESNGSVGGTHAYTTAGVYTVTLTVADDDGGMDSASSEYLVVFDSKSGFVTGNGAIDSPAGACSLTDACANAAGTASFGFVSKYKKGATVPSGITQFNFKAGDLDFQSTSYQWLVVAGSRAQYKGSGTINGSGDYGFLLTAVDGDASGRVGADQFRIKIWEQASGTIVYDNQMGDSDSASLSTAIERGNIIIH